MLILLHNQFILITMCSNGSGGRGTLIDWQVFAYTVWDKMSAGALAVTCRELLAKQTDEGNLSCSGLRRGRLGPLALLLASSVTCHSALALERAEQAGGSGRLDTNKSAGGNVTAAAEPLLHQHRDQCASTVGHRAQPIRKSSRIVERGSLISAWKDMVAPRLGLLLGKKETPHRF